MGVKTEVDRLNSAKSAIKAAIESKGVTVPADEKIDNYATYINQIQTGSGGGGSVELYEHKIQMAGTKISFTAYITLYTTSETPMTSSDLISFLIDNSPLNTDFYPYYTVQASGDLYAYDEDSYEEPIERFGVVTSLSVGALIKNVTVQGIWFDVVLNGQTIYPVQGFGESVVSSDIDVQDAVRKVL